MAQNYATAYLEWIRLAEEANRRRDYESAARFLRYVTIYFGTISDVSNQKKFAIATGDCYLQAAKEKGSENDRLKAILLCIRAADSFREGGSEESAKLCNPLIRNHYSIMRKGETMKNNGDAHNLKDLGDFFAKNDDFETAIECYGIAAEKAFEEEKPLLSGRLHRDMGDCYQNLKDFENAAKNYATVADIYLKCQEYFEAAWNYCESSFLFIHVGKMGEASIVAEKASSACDEGRITVLLNDLSYICRMLCNGSPHEAEQRWNRIKTKFKGSYTNLIDSCFTSLREKSVDRT